MYEELYNTLKVRFGAGNSSVPMGDWITANTTIKKRPFSYEDYAFQKQIASDMHTDMSVIKCSQIGLTEIQIRKYLGMLTRGDSLNGIFTLPNEKMFTRVYNARIKPILEADDIFNPIMDVTPVRRRDQVQIRSSFGYITGCTEGDATSTSADFLMHDEYDLSPPNMMALYQSRLQNSELHMTQRFSTPSFTGFAISQEFELSDQNEYMYRCEACNHWQIPLFNQAFVHVENFPYEVEHFWDLSPEQITSIDLSGSYIQCEHCQSRLDMKNPALREWVPKYPGRTAKRGYQVRPFSTSRLKPPYVFQQLAQYAGQGFLRGFFNTVLGEPYDSADARIQKADTEACMARGTPGYPDITPGTPVFLGVDIGMICHLTLSIDDPETGQPHFILFETFGISDLAQRIADLRRVYNIVQGCADRFPYTPDVDALRDATSKVVMPVQYRGTASLAPNKDELGEIMHYSASRTAVLDRIHAMVGHRALVLSGYTTHRETLLIHLSDMVRIEKSDDVEVTWTKTSGNDHFFHAMALSLLARRVCEHMYHANTDEMKTVALLTGTDDPAVGGLGLLGGASKSLVRIGRMGV